jgi:hypothetical protein
MTDTPRRGFFATLYRNRFAIGKALKDVTILPQSTTFRIP